MYWSCGDSSESTGAAAPAAVVDVPAAAAAAATAADGEPRICFSWRKIEDQLEFRLQTIEIKNQSVPTDR